MDEPQAADALTEREREVLVLVAQGLSNRQIADALVISERTARTRMSNILEKLGATSRTQAALVAIREGIAPAPRHRSPSSDPAPMGHSPPRIGSFDRRLHELIDLLSGVMRPARDKGTDVQEIVAGDPRKAPKLRVLIVDDDARVRRALRSLIECSPDLTVVGEAGSTGSAKRLDLELLPDVVVLDLLLPHASDGVDVLRELRCQGRPVVTISGMSQLRREAMATGAHAFIDKDGRDLDRLLEMIRAACRHHLWPPGG